MTGRSEIYGGWVKSLTHPLLVWTVALRATKESESAEVHFYGRRVKAGGVEEGGATIDNVFQFRLDFAFEDFLPVHCEDDVLAEVNQFGAKVNEQFAFRDRLIESVSSLDRSST